MDIGWEYPATEHVPIKLEREYIPLTQDDPLKRQPCLKLNQQILGKENYTPLKDGILSTIEYFFDNL